MTHEEYLKGIVVSRKLELKELQIQHRIHIAEYNLKSKMLNDEIDSIEKQLQAPTK